MARWLVDVPFAGVPPLDPLLLAIDAICGKWHGFQSLERDLLLAFLADSITTPSGATGYTMNVTFDAAQPGQSTNQAVQR
jgi:hypothetical protein